MELGTKWSLLDGGLMADASLFETDKINARIPDLSLPGFNTLGGNQRVQGFEVMLQGKIMEGWNVSLGYDYLSSGTTKTVAGGPPLGFPLLFTPHNNVTFWTTYQVLPELEIGGGGEYVGSRYAQTSAPDRAGARLPDSGRHGQICDQRPAGCAGECLQSDRQDSIMI